jgi:hypothetical protein
MKNKRFLALLAVLLGPCLAFAQDSTRYQLRLQVPVYDFGQNKNLPHHYPSMNQALEFSSDLYELSFLGIDKLGDGLFKPKTKPYTKAKKAVNFVFKYALTLGFSKYGSELPIPLGVWGHEEFHRSVLGVAGVSSKNGNWLPNRWDGTVYGITDKDLTKLKAKDPDQLAYAYVAGVQSEILLSAKISVQDFYHKKTLPKSALLLYNAYYVYDYFKFSTGPWSDSVKINAPQHENADPRERDFAGVDLSAWVYDMFNPGRSYMERDSFPNGEGVNRRIGFSDLSPEAQEFLLDQKKLSLLNFINPAIFFINRIPLGRHFSFNFFAQYAPTHFGNNVAVMLPVKYKNSDLLIGLRQYNSFKNKGYGVDLGTYNRRLSDRFSVDAILHLWDQPKTFFGQEKHSGGALDLLGKFEITKNTSVFLAVTGKTDGWMMGSPYLKSNFSSRVGLNFDLKKRHSY